MTRGIIVFGASGSGTTTLGRKLAKQLNFTYLDADDFFWEEADIPFSIMRPYEKRLEILLSTISECPTFVLSGSICDWDKPILQLLDLAVYVSTPTDIRIERLREREFNKFGKRIFKGGDMFDIHHNFIEWTSRYDTAGLEQCSHVLHMEWAKVLNCPMIAVDGTAMVETNATGIATRYYTTPDASSLKKKVAKE